MGAAAYAYKPQFESAIDRHETDSRRRRKRRRNVVGLARKLGYCVIPLVLILCYLGLMAGLTAQTYRLAADQHVRSSLLERHNALHSRVAQLESVDRLQAVARQLHMTEPRKVAFISTPSAVQPVEHRFALFARILGVTRWLGVR